METEQKIRSLVPSLQELPTIHIFDEIEKLIRLIEEKVPMSFIRDGESSLTTTATQAVSNYRDLQRQDYIQQLEQRFERDIQLHHVLQAIRIRVYQKGEVLNSTVPVVEYITTTLKDIIHMWDLTKNYHKQSEEVKEFIKDLIK